jgi:CheY-like chemotaxis protein/two-component sensor histidine kinase
MVHLINDLLDIARITSGKMELKIELAELGRIVRNAVEASTPAINAGGHTIAVDVPQGSMLLQADVTRLTQVLSNILNNAAKYTPPGGHIDLRARRASDFVEIDIVDNGMGIAPGSLSAIFEMFTQVGRDVHAVPGGLGIGLNLVRRLVELHGGFVSAQSAGVGLGSTFTVRLPLAMTPTKAPVSETQLGSSSAALRILVVDDNLDASESLAMLLRFGDHEIRTAGGGKEALEILAEFPSDVVILDIGMPVLNGYELAREIRKLSGFERVTLIALTGWGGEGDRKRSEAAGFDGHLTKPVAFEELERLLARVKTIAAT